MKAAWILFAIFLSAGAAFANIKVKVHYSPVANLVYQLDCLSSAVRSCGRKTYQELWDRNLIKGPEDQALIQSWGELMKRYRQELEFERTESQAITGRFEGVQLSSKIRIASFQSKTVEEYFSRLDLVLLPKDKEKFEKVVRRFYPSFEKWWKATALPKGKGFARTTESLLVSKEISKKLQQYFHFYQAVLPENYVVHFNLFYRPESDEPTAGQQIENYSVSEFLPSEKPADRIDVIIHELCHFFFENATDENFSKFQKNFEVLGKVEATAAYNLLNETLATALGNGLINQFTMKKDRWEKYLATEQSLYNNPHIDRAAKAILPWIGEWVSKGRTLYDPQFVTGYVSSLEKALGSELTSPQLLLNEMVLIGDNKYNGRFRDIVRKSLRASSIYNSEGAWSDPRLIQTYNENPKLSALVVTHPANLNQLKEKSILNEKDFEQLKSTLKKTDQVIFSYRRTPAIPGYVVVAPDYEKAVALVEKIGTIKQGFAGPYQAP